MEAKYIYRIDYYENKKYKYVLVRAESHEAAIKKSRIKKVERIEEVTERIKRTERQLKCKHTIIE